MPIILPFINRGWGPFLGGIKKKCPTPLTPPLLACTTPPPYCCINYAYNTSVYQSRGGGNARSNAKASDQIMAEDYSDLVVTYVKAMAYKRKQASGISHVDYVSKKNEKY